MVFQGIVGLACLIFLSTGAMGMDYSVPVGSLLLMGVVIRKFLDTYWSLEPREEKLLHLENRQPHR